MCDSNSVSAVAGVHEKSVRLTAPGSASERWETHMCPTAPPAGGSVHVGGRRPREPPAPSSASSYSQT